MPELPGAPPNFRRPRHRLVWQVLESLNGDLLARARCWFGGGTRVAMELGEFRESVGVDFLCEDREGYRILRSTVTQNLAEASVKVFQSLIERAARNLDQRTISRQRYEVVFQDAGGNH